MRTNFVACACVSWIAPAGYMAHCAGGAISRWKADATVSCSSCSGTTGGVSLNRGAVDRLIRDRAAPCGSARSQLFVPDLIEGGVDLDLGRIDLGPDGVD